MIVIADTTPLNYLVLIDIADLLSALFAQVIIPRSVLNELRSSQAPEKVRQWFLHCPDWLIVKDVQGADPTLIHLDLGEREVVTLAQELHADLVLLDENRGRREALSRGFNVAGTLGLLDRAAAKGLINVPTAVSQLRQTTFRISPRLLNALLDRHKS